ADLLAADAALAVDVVEVRIHASHVVARQAGIGAGVVGGLAQHDVTPSGAAGAETQIYQNGKNATNSAKCGAHGESPCLLLGLVWLPLYQPRSDRRQRKE